MPPTSVVSDATRYLNPTTILPPGSQATKPFDMDAFKAAGREFSSTADTLKAKTDVLNVFPMMGRKDSQKLRDIFEKGAALSDNELANLMKQNSKSFQGNAATMADDLIAVRNMKNTDDLAKHTIHMSHDQLQEFITTWGRTLQSKFGKKQSEIFAPVRAARRVKKQGVLAHQLPSQPVALKQSTGSSTFDISDSASRRSDAGSDAGSSDSISGDYASVDLVLPPKGGNYMPIPSRSKRGGDDAVPEGVPMEIDESVYSRLPIFDNPAAARGLSTIPESLVKGPIPYKMDPADVRRAWDAFDSGTSMQRLREKGGVDGRLAATAGDTPRILVVDLGNANRVMDNMRAQKGVPSSSRFKYLMILFKRAFRLGREPFIPFSIESFTMEEEQGIETYEFASPEEFQDRFAFLLQQVDAEQLTPEEYAVLLHLIVMEADQAGLELSEEFIEYIALVQRDALAPPEIVPQETPWYQNMWIIGGLALLVLIILMFAGFMFLR